MKQEIQPHLEAIASIMKMTKVNDEFYYGEHGTLFKATNFGFRLAVIEDCSNLNHPHYLNPNLLKPKGSSFFRPITDTELSIGECNCKIDEV